MSKPFDLERAKAGDPVETVRGNNVRILCFDRQHLYCPMVGIVTDTGSTEDIFTWTINGKVNISGGNSLYDLVMAPVKKEGWLNIFKNADGENSFYGGIYKTEQDAKINIASSLSHLATIKIEWSE